MFRVTKRTWTCLVKIWWLLQHYNTGRNYDAANLRNSVAVTSFPFPFPRCWMFCISWLPPPENTGRPGDLERDDWHFTNLVDCFWIGEPRPPDTHGGCLACVEDFSVFLLRFIKESKDIFCLSRVTFWTSDTVYWSDCKWLLSKQRVIIDISF